MRSKRNKTRLLLATGSGFTDVKRATLDEAKKRGWSCFSFSLQDDISPRIFKPHVAISTETFEEQIYKILHQIGVHTVRIGILPTPLDETVPAVLSDLNEEGRMAAEHYAERGFRHVGVVRFGDFRSYYTTFRTHAIELGCKFHVLDISKALPKSINSPDKTFREYHRRFLAALSKVPKPIGLLMPGDNLAATVCKFCILSNIQVPDEVAILGRGDEVTVCDLSPVSLSSIHLNVESRISAAFSILDDMLAGKEAPKESVIIPPTGITSRDSTDVRASQHPDVTKALRYMWDNYSSLELSVDNVAQVVGFSRRTLERLFRSELNQTVNEALLSRRLERCCELLITTDTNVSDLCYAVGLRSREHLHRAFKRTYGITMQKYRLKHRQA